MNIETRKFKNYSIDIIEMEDFKTYLNTFKDNFSHESLKAFLNSVWIPANYFLEQPENTKLDLIENKYKLTQSNPKYSKYNIVILRNSTEILNATRVKYSEMDLRYNFIKDIENMENSIVVRTFRKEGVLNLFLFNPTTSKIKKEEVTEGLFIDIPLMFNKNIEAHKGLFQMSPNKVEQVYHIDSYKNLYDKEIDCTDLTNSYNSIKYFVEDKLAKKDNLENKLDLFKYTTDAENELLHLEEQKHLSSSLAKKISKRIDKHACDNILSYKDLLYFILDFDYNVQSLKKVSKLREIFKLFRSELEKVYKKGDSKKCQEKKILQRA
jgi:hypothetical protein